MSGAALLPEPVVACDACGWTSGCRKPPCEPCGWATWGWLRRIRDIGRVYRTTTAATTATTCRVARSAQVSCRPSGIFLWPAVHADAIYLPLDVSLDPDRLLGAARQPRSALERDGLSTFGAALFVDLELVSSTTDSLMDAGDHLRYSRAVPRRPRGIHAALDIEEATLVAVPDACHRGWRRGADDPPRPPMPSAPIARPPWWHAIACETPLPDPLPATPPFGQFLDCTIRLVPQPNNLRRLDAGEGGTYTVAWDTPEESQSVLEEAQSEDFSDAVVIYSGTDPRLTLYGRSDGTYYYRVRAEMHGQTSDWSDGLAIRVLTARRWLVDPPEQFADDALIIVQRALMRVAAARGDLFAVLALPAHYREESSRSHAELLKRSAAAYVVPPLDETSPAATGVRLPLSLPIGAGEARAFSFGAVYHPWLFVREPEQPAGGALLPPDGTVLRPDRKPRTPARRVDCSSERAARRRRGAVAVDRTKPARRAHERAGQSDRAGAARLSSHVSARHAQR